MANTAASGFIDFLERILVRISKLLSILVASGLAAGCVIHPDAFSDQAGTAPDGWLQFRLVEEDATLLVETTGDLSFDSSSAMVVPASEDAVFRVTETSSGFSRKLESSLDPDAEAKHRYWENDKAQDFDAGAHQWLADVLPRILRDTALLAEQWTAHLLEQGGVDRVLEEIALINSSEARRVYAEELLAQRDLSSEQVKKLIAELRQIESSSRLKEALTALAPALPEGGEVTLDLVAGCSQISSSSARKACLQELAESRQVDSPVAVALARAAAGIRSSSEKTGALISLIDRAPRLPEVDEAILEAFTTIRSSSERSRAIKILIDAGPRPEVLTRLAGLIRDISSSAERTTSLQRFSRLLPHDDPDLLAVYLDAVRELSSMAAKERTLLPLLRRPNLSPQTRNLVREFIENELPDGVLRRRFLSKLRDSD